MYTVIGVMGGALADEVVMAEARRIGQLIAEHGFVLLNGGRDAGVMAASAQGAHERGGLVVGVLPTETTTGVSPHVDIAIATGMGDARNVINVLSSHLVISLPGGAGTISEIALALKSGRTVITIGFPLGSEFARYYDDGSLIDARDADSAIEVALRVLSAHTA
ncbi:MAG: TIGR00725 family protein [Coriobacteriia bacterium]|nr:TIGR00725 family protein [Coriobacteriia bacterium]